MIRFYLVNEMIIYQDTRQQKGKHNNIENYFARKGIEVVNKKLDVGDYMLPDNPNITIDTKYGLEELAKNLTNKSDNARFMKEVRRAFESGVKLVILIEQRGIKGTQDLLKWRSKHTGVSGIVMARQMFRLEMAYQVKFEYCDPSSTGKRIMEILLGVE